MYEVDEYTVSLLHFDDGLKDECGLTWINNNATITDSQKVFGNGALSLDVGKYIYTDDTSNFDFTEEFTVEMWAMFTNYPTTHSGNSVHCLFSQYKNTTNEIDLGISGMDHIGYDAKNNDTGSTLTKMFPFDFNLNQWYHIAFVSNGTKNYIFVDGKKIIDYPIEKKLPLLKNTRACIGKFFFPQYEYDYIGFMDEFRISNIARWTEDFTPNPEPEQPTSNVLLRVTMIDSSEREYKVSKAEADGFVAWMSRDVNTGTTSYPLPKVITESREYLLFDKIISFDVKEMK